MGETVDRVCARLDFGAVVVNQWSVFAYTAMCLGGTWGAFHKDNVRSGRGRLGNKFNVPNVVKTVVRASLSNMQIDLSVPPPTPLVDLLHVLTVKSTSFFGGLKNFAVFSVMRVLQAVFHPWSTGRRFEGVL